MNGKMVFGLVGLFLVGCAGPRAATSATSATPPLKVAVYADCGANGVGALEWYRIVRDSPDMTLKLVDVAGLCAGALEGQDVLVMPGGRSKTEFATLGPKGMAKIKDFIRDGGAYLGTCAGCCIFMDGKDRGRVIPWNTCGYESALFFPYVDINETGAKALGLDAGKRQIRYHGGPFMWPTTNVIADASFECWGTLDSECSYRGAVDRKKKMFGSTVIVGGTYGKGRVFVTSMHPEYFESTHDIVRGAFRYLTGRDVTITRPRRARGDLSVGYNYGPGTGIPAIETALEIAALDGVDMQVINEDDILWADRMAHLDVYAAPDGIKAKQVDVRCAVERFIARGGLFLTCKAKGAPYGSVLCADRREILRRIRELTH